MAFRRPEGFLRTYVDHTGASTGRERDGAHSCNARYLLSGVLRRPGYSTVTRRYSSARPRSERGPSSTGERCRVRRPAGARLLFARQSPQSLPQEQQRGIHRSRRRPRDPRLARQPHRRGRGRPRRRFVRAGGGAQRRVHRRLRGGRAARRRRPLRRQGRRQGGRGRDPDRSGPPSRASTPTTSAWSTRRCSSSTAPPTRPSSAPTPSSASRSPSPAPPPTRPACRSTATSAARTPTCCRCR